MPPIAQPAPAALSIAVLIPAYRPGRTLVDVVGALSAAGLPVIVVDDGSGAEFREIFVELSRPASVHILRHAVNLGKGAALKTGMNYALVEFPDLAGVVTADADGQHDPRDIVHVAEAFAASPASLVIGSREFAGEIPLRSRVGNLITRRAMRLLVGQSLTDTQSGLRAVPRGLMERLLRVSASGYEFELEMLIAARHLGMRVAELPIRTIYQPGNPTSHFHPLRDSMRIYFVLLRFSLISLSTAALDNAVFYVLYHATGAITGPLAAARVLALTYNYLMVRSAVFHSHREHRVVAPRYVAVGVVYICVSYGLINLIARYLTVGVVPSKMMAESILFIANFAIQRDFVFARPSPGREML